MAGKVKAVLDGFEDEYALLIVNDTERCLVPCKQLPPNAREGSRLKIGYENALNQDTEEVRRRVGPVDNSGM